MSFAGNGGRTGTMTVEAHEFIRRVLPSAFVRIRYYGFLANRHRNQKLQLCRTLLGATEPNETDRMHEGDWTGLLQSLTGIDPQQCPNCKQGRLVPIEIIPPSPPFHTRDPAGGRPC